MNPILWTLCLLWSLGIAFAQNKTLGTEKLPAGTEKRAAVIFANQDYTDLRYDLQKTHNDADDMKTLLDNMGFKVIVFEKDLNRTAFYREINQLRETLKGYSLVFFYYSGHGAEYQGQNYLIPTDIASLDYDSDIKANGVDMKLIYQVLGEARVKTSIIALDACRSLPIGKGGLSSGLSIPRDNPAGTFTMYATEAGKIARENRKGRNSYFTQELLKQLAVPNLDINQIHYNTRTAVKAVTKADTNEEQAPDVADKLDNKLVLLQKDILDSEKEAMRVEIERLKAESEAAKKNAATPNRTELPFMDMRLPDMDELVGEYDFGEGKSLLKYGYKNVQISKKSHHQYEFSFDWRIHNSMREVNGTIRPYSKDSLFFEGTSTTGYHNQGFAENDMDSPTKVSAFLQRRYIRVKGRGRVDRWYFTQPIDSSKHLFDNTKNLFIQKIN